MISNIIYKIPCKSCEGVYIGQSKQYLKNRIKQHENSTKLDIKDPNTSTALSEHTFNNFHKFDFGNTTIIDHEKNKRKRNILEMIYIQKHKTAVNFRNDTENLNKIYASLIVNTV